MRQIAPRERVEKVAPYLTLDGDPYPSVVGGKLVWIVDGQVRYEWVVTDEVSIWKQIIAHGRG